MDMDALKARLKTEEGVRLVVYRDTAGHPTIGVGLNLDRPDARTLLSRFGADLGEVLAGKPLTLAQVDDLLDVTACEAVESARAHIPGLDAMPEGVQQVLCDLVFNMGWSTLAQFRRFLGYIALHYWREAADALADSLWHRQVGSRAVRLEQMLRDCAQEQETR